MYQRRHWAIAAGLAVAFTAVSPVANAADELNIYSYRQSFLTKPFIEKFEAETGTKVNIVFMKKGMLERLKAEGANSPADVIMTVDIARLHALAEADLLQPVDSAVLEQNVPAQYRAKDGLWFGLTTRAPRRLRLQGPGRAGGAPRLRRPRRREMARPHLHAVGLPHLPARAALLHRAAQGRGRGGTVGCRA